VNPLLYPNKNKKKKKRIKKFAALWIVGILTLLYSASEIFVFAYLPAHSVAMLTDGLHNLSDCMQLGVAYLALKKSSSSKTEKYTYGWKRTEIIGALMNACFLISLCVYIFVEAIQKFITATEPLFSNELNGIIFITIAGAGILVNGLGSVIFAALGGHGHSHSHGHKKNDGTSLLDAEKQDGKKGGSVYIEKTGGKDLNMSAVFLHYLGDCVASGLLLTVGLLAYFFKQSWTNYLDPIASILISCMLLWSSVPLTKECAYLLLQQVPKNINMSEVRRYLSQILYLQGYHDLHIWQLSDDITIGTIHACVYDTDVTHVETVKEEIKKVFHNYEVHSTTVQVEILSAENEESPFICKHNCKAFCTQDWCCKGYNNNNAATAVLPPPTHNVELSET